MMVNHSVGHASANTMAPIASRRTIRLALRQHLRQINFGLPNQVWLSWIIRITCHREELAPLHLRRSLPIAFRWWRRRLCTRNMWELVDVLKELKADFLIPLGVLPATLNGLSTPLFSIEDNLTVRILLAYVTLVWQVPLGRGCVW